MKFFEDQQARINIRSLLLISAALWIVYALLNFATGYATVFIFKFLSLCFLIGSICTSGVTLFRALSTIGAENGGLNRSTLSLLLVTSLVIALVLDYGHPNGFLNEPLNFLNWGRLLVTLGFCALAYKLVDSKTNLYKAFMMTWLVTLVLQMIGLGESEDVRQSIREGGMGLSFLFQTFALWLAIWVGSKK